jgi:hypothetical protein
MKKTDPKQKQRVALVHRLDVLNSQWNTLRTMAALLELCQENGARMVDSQVVGDAAHMMVQELDRMHEGLQQLDRERVR